MTNNSPLSFIESVTLVPPAQPLAVTEAEPVRLDQLPNGVVAGGNLIDFTAVQDHELRSGISQAMVFASRAADAAIKDGGDGEDWFAAYVTSLGRLGFLVSQSSLSVSRFKKRGLSAHKAIIPFLTGALGGFKMGPAIITALESLNEDRDEPWIRLFDRESRKIDVREMHFSAAASDGAQTAIRHVAVQLRVDQDTTNVLFFRITDASAEFESAITTLSISNSLIAVLNDELRQTMKDDIASYIAEVRR